MPLTSPRAFRAEAAQAGSCAYGSCSCHSLQVGVHLWKFSNLGSDAWVNGSWSALIVNHIPDLAQVAQSHGDHMVKANGWFVRRCDCAPQHNVRPKKHAVDAQTPSLVAGHGIRHFI